MQIKIINILLVGCFLFFISQGNPMCKDTDSLENKDCRYIREMTLEESEDYLKQQKKLHDLRFGTPGQCVFATRILGLVGSGPTQEVFINPPFVIKKDSFPGYILDKDLTVEITDGSAPYLYFEIAADTEIWPEVGMPASGSKGIRVYIMCRDSGDVAASSLFGLLEPRFHNRYAGQNMFKCPEGPGDKCLLGAGTKNGVQYVVRLPPTPWSSEHLGSLAIGDGGIFFVRGNIAVNLQSSYDNFGCMDLARKLDAFLLGEAKRQAEENMKESETMESE